MARGWESKSIEAQQEEAAEKKISGKPRLSSQEAARAREKENLMLALRNVGEQLERSRDPRHRTMLEQAQRDLKRKIEEFNSL